jgi:hypothetical protein
MLNPYISLTEAELLDQRGDLLAELKRIRSGIQLNSSGIGGKSFGYNRERLTALREDLNLTVAALSAKNPTQYGSLVTETFSDLSGDRSN